MEAVKQKAPKGYIQRGIMAIRSPTGEFLPSVPFYEKATEALKAGEEQLLKDGAQLFKPPKGGKEK